MKPQIKDSLNRNLHRSPHDITKASGSNFARAFFFLDKTQRAAIEAVYAFARVLDDAVDDFTEVEDQTHALNFWEGHFKKMCTGTPEGPIFTELAQAIDAFSIPLEPFEHLIRGCRRDIGCHRYQSFTDLEAYCYDVASTVGLISLPIFRIDSAAARAPSIALGKALQLTNILRDVGEDLARDRIYLPLNDMAHFGYTLEDLRNKTYNQAFYELMAFEAARAEKFYAEAAPFLQNGSEKGYLAPWLMGTTYREIFEKLKRSRFQVFEGKISLSKREKFLLFAQVMWRSLRG